MFCFLILKDITLPLHQHENKTINTKHYDSEPVDYQNKSTTKEIQQRNRGKFFQIGANFKNCCGV